MSGRPVTAGGTGDSGGPVDVVVVGAGVVGAAAALTLAERDMRVLVLDADLAGRATSAGAGIVTPIGVGTDPRPELTAAAIEHYRQLILSLTDDHGLTTGYERVGLLMLPDPVDTTDPAAALAAVERRAAESGVRAQRTTAPASAWPELGNPGPDDALFVPDAARVDGRLLRDALTTAGARRGVRSLTETATLAQRGDEVVVTADGRQIAADRVLVCAGAWSGGLLAPLGHPQATHPDRGQIVHLQLPGDSTGTGSRPMLQSLRGHYVLGFPAGRVVAGATHEPEAGFDYRVTAGGQAQVLAQTLHMVPGLAAAMMVETRVGFRPATVTGRPLVGALPGLANLTVATGMGSVGLTLGPLLGRLAAEQLLGSASPLLAALAPGDG